MDEGDVIFSLVQRILDKQDRIMDRQDKILEEIYNNRKITQEISAEQEGHIKDVSSNFEGLTCAIKPPKIDSVEKQKVWIPVVLKIVEMVFVIVGLLLGVQVIK